jgi:hypothetical protein
MIHRIIISCGFFACLECVGMRATCALYDSMLKIPEKCRQIYLNTYRMYTKLDRMYAESAQILSQIVDKSIDKLGAHMHLYGGIDKIPEICRHMEECGAKWD